MRDDYPVIKWPPPLVDRMMEVGDARIADMDAAGIDVQVLTLTQPALEVLPAKKAVPLAAELNDFLAARIAEHPTRFDGLAAVPAVDARAAADELERSVRELGLKGALVNGQTNGRFLDDPQFMPLLERIAELDVPLYLHPAPAPKEVSRLYYQGFGDIIEAHLAMAGWGWHSELGLHAVRLVLAGVFDRLPNLQVVIGHMGEIIPFMLDRMVRFLGPAIELERPLEEYFRTNFWYTTSGFVWDPPLQCTLDTIGAERLLFAVDYPFDDNARATGWFNAAPLSDRQRALIAHENADRLFGLTH